MIRHQTRIIKIVLMAVLGSGLLGTGCAERAARDTRRAKAPKALNLESLKSEPTVRDYKRLKYPKLR